MDATEYNQFQMPLANSAVSGELVVNLHAESVDAAHTIDHHYNMTATLCLSGSSDSTSVDTISRFQPRWFPNRDRLTDEYKIEDESEKHISSIQSELATSFPDIGDDFDAFIKRYYAFKSDDTTYLDLIGVRSTLFLKLIFSCSEQNYGVQRPKNRRNDIRRFVFGSNTPLPAFDPVIEVCYRLYNELSSQDSSGLSVKLGDVNAAYIESLFKRLLGNIAAILDLRSRYFSL